MNEGLFFFMLECDKCEEEIYFGPCLTTLTHRDRLGNELPVVPADMVSQTTFTCPRCGADNSTGDLDIYVEGGEEPDDEEEDDDD